MASSSTSYAPVEHVALGLVDQLPILQIVVPFIAAPIIVAVCGVRRVRIKTPSSKGCRQTEHSNCSTFSPCHSRVGRRFTELAIASNSCW